MIDDYNRVIDYIRISVTDRCNLRCVYCMPEKGIEFVPHESILTYEEILRLCKCFVKLGIHKVKLTGGEPLVRKNLPYLINNIKAIEGIDNITLTTNGILLAEQMESLANAGIDAINVSLDTLNPKQFAKLTRFEQLDQVKAGLREALQYENVVLKINCVSLKENNNEEDLLSMVSLAKDNLLHVRFIEMMPIGLGKEMKSYTEDEIKQIIESKFGTLIPCNELLGNGPSHYYKIEGFKGKIGFISAISHQFCSSCNRIRLTSEGYLKNCLQYASGVDLKTVLRNGISDDALLETIQLTIMNKPKEHHFIDYLKKKEKGFEYIQNQDGNISGNINSNINGNIKGNLNCNVNGNININETTSFDERLENRRMSQIGG